jgi:diguanylate cyclase (GGDEF)-like protein/PAS domain S-box-containing protein
MSRVTSQLDRFQALWERGSDLALVCDADLVIRYAGPALVEMFDYPPEEVLGVAGLSFVHPDDADLFLQVWERVAASPGGHERVEIRVRHRNGSWLWVEERLTNLLDDPHVGGVVLNVRDVTERRGAVEALAASERFHRSILERTHEGIWVADPTGRTRFANTRMAELLRCDHEALVRGYVWDFFDEEDIRAQLRTRFERRARGLRDEYELPTPDGDGGTRWLHVSAAPWYEAEGPYAGSIAVISDVTERKRMEDALEMLSLYDPLTGLPNRSLLTDRFQELSDLQQERGEQFALLIVDIDRLGRINDECGLAAGDAVIVELARRFKEAARDGDTVARSSGDEFVLLCPKADAYSAGRIAEGLCAALAEPVVVDGHSHPVRVSIGVVDSASLPPDQLGAAAAAALARAKSAGGGRSVVHDGALPAVDVDRNRLLDDLRIAVGTGGMEVWYQPVVHLDTDEISGVEALLRWTHPVHGPIAPATFIPLAEETGLIDQLGAMTLAIACADAMTWPARDGRELYVAVNLSASQLAAPGLTDLVTDALRTSGLSPTRLTLEVTETAVLTDMAVALRTLEELRAMGVCIALDDFGTGYSSLTYLKQFPVKVIKIDRSFVSGLGINEADSAIVASVISLGAAIDVHVVAEGVETLQQQELLRRLGCRLGQGFLWSPAVPAASLATTLDEIERGSRTTLRQRTRNRVSTDPTTAARIRALHRAGASLSTVAAALNADGLTTATGTRWHRQSVARVIAADTPVCPRHVEAPLHVRSGASTWSGRVRPRRELPRPIPRRRTRSHRGPGHAGPSAGSGTRPRPLPARGCRHRRRTRW